MDEQYGCLIHRHFGFGEAIRFTFVVESSPYNGLIKLVENYRVTAPSGKTVLEAEDTSNFNYELKATNLQKSIL